MPKIILPMRDGVPFVAAQDGCLPNPAWAVIGAIRHLGQQWESQETTEILAPQKMELMDIYENGVQVEWLEFGSSLEWVTYMESATTKMARRTVVDLQIFLLFQTS